jgi:hypothetical protein
LGHAGGAFLGNISFGLDKLGVSSIIIIQII